TMALRRWWVSGTSIPFRLPISASPRPRSISSPSRTRQDCPTTSSTSTMSRSWRTAADRDRRRPCHTLRSGCETDVVDIPRVTRQSGLILNAEFVDGSTRDSQIRERHGVGIPLAGNRCRTVFLHIEIDSDGYVADLDEVDPPYLVGHCRLERE